MSILDEMNKSFGAKQLGSFKGKIEEVQNAEIANDAAMSEYKRALNDIQQIWQRLSSLENSVKSATATATVSCVNGVATVNIKINL